MAGDGVSEGRRRRESRRGVRVDATLQKPRVWWHSDGSCTVAELDILPLLPPPGLQRWLPLGGVMSRQCLPVYEGAVRMLGSAVLAAACIMPPNADIAVQGGGLKLPGG